MKILTKLFGELEIDENEVISFENGLYAFRDEKKFILLKDEESLFLSLQSINTPGLAFIAVEPWSFCSEYEFDLSEKLESELKLESEADVLVINLVSVPDKVEDIVANLKAPIIINKRLKLAKQIILDKENYPSKYKLFNQYAATAEVAATTAK